MLNKLVLILTLDHLKFIHTRASETILIELLNKIFAFEGPLELLMETRIKMSRLFAAAAVSSRAIERCSDHKHRKRKTRLTWSLY